MSEQLTAIISSIWDSFLTLWPYLAITIPLAAAVNLSGASRYINKAFKKGPVTAIVLATLVGAFSPFCSCGVIPVVASLLIGGVPLAPVMSFWIAAPLMDPEMFFLSVVTIGWELAIWRLAATLVISLAAGFITHGLMQKGWLGEKVLNESIRATLNKPSPTARLKAAWEGLKRGWRGLTQLMTGNLAQPAPAACGAGCGTTEPLQRTALPSPALSTGCGCGTGDRDAEKEETCENKKESGGEVSFGSRLFSEVWQASVMVAKFMVLAFLIEALIRLYVPTEWIVGLLGNGNGFAVLLSAGLGVPVYTSNLTALPMMKGLLAQGMNPAAVLAFLVSGPATTIPAMAAVWGLVKRKVFVLYVSIALVGAVLAGYLFSLAGLLWG